MHFRGFLLSVIAFFMLLGGLLPAYADENSDLVIERVTTIAPFPRGLVMKDGTLYVLCRGRVRGAGGVSAAIYDQAGTIYAVDPNITEPVSSAEVSEAIRNNGKVFALPTEPQFKLWDREAAPPESDRNTDRPYCTLRFHKPTQSFYICGYSGIDKQRTKEDSEAFSKNYTDCILRYDLRTKSWHEVERHDVDAAWQYPHHDPDKNSAPHGWLKGPDNCLTLGDNLYAVSKDNSLLVRYDLAELTENPNALASESKVVMGDTIQIKGKGLKKMEGQSALAFNDGWMYVAYRTTSEIIRFKLDDSYLPLQPIEAELVAQFEPYDRETLKSANVTDMCFDDEGRLYVVSAKPSRIYRFSPDPADVFDARGEYGMPWADMAALTSNPRMKSENVLYHDGWLYVTSGDGYSYQAGADGTVYRVKVDD